MEIVNILRKRGANPEFKNRQDKKALDIGKVISSLKDYNFNFFLNKSLQLPQLFTFIRK